MEQSACQRFVDVVGVLSKREQVDERPGLVSGMLGRLKSHLGSFGLSEMDSTGTDGWMDGPDGWAQGVVGGDGTDKE